MRFSIAAQSLTRRRGEGLIIFFRLFLKPIDQLAIIYASGSADAIVEAVGVEEKCGEEQEPQVDVVFRRHKEHLVVG